nr:immunoglobulin light chain junction region [Macaca mulatta]
DYYCYSADTSGSRGF